MYHCSRKNYSEWHKLLDQWQSFLNITDILVGSRTMFLIKECWSFKVLTFEEKNDIKIGR